MVTIAGNFDLILSDIFAGFGVKTAGSGCFRRSAGLFSPFGSDFGDFGGFDAAAGFDFVVFDFGGFDGVDALCGASGSIVSVSMVESSMSDGCFVAMGGFGIRYVQHL